MRLIVEANKLSGVIAAIPSKSYAHRILIAAALAKGKTKIICRQSNLDISATIDCLVELGGDIERTDYGFCVGEMSPKTLAEIDCKESGSTLRFLLPLAAALGIHTRIKGADGLAKRPISGLLLPLRQGGINVVSQALPLEISGKLKGGVYEVDGSISSQYLTGLLLSLPIVDGDSQIIIIGKRVSASYLDITLDVLAQFGIVIEKTDYGYYILGNQEYSAPAEVVVEGDWSNAAFWLVAGAMGSPIKITGLNMLSKQGDRKITTLLGQMGAEIEEFSDSCIVTKEINKVLVADCDDVPDLVPILSVAALKATGESEISGLSRLKAKESDRLTNTVDMLRRLGADIKNIDNSIIISGGKNLEGASLDSYNDHRMAMSAMIASTILPIGSQLILEGAEAVAKSYPNFVADFVSLGGRVCSKN